MSDHFGGEIRGVDVIVDEIHCSVVGVFYKSFKLDAALGCGIADDDLRSQTGWSTSLEVFSPSRHEPQSMHKSTNQSTCV